MGIERGHLVNLGHGQAQLRRQGLQMARREMPETVLKQMKILDQKIAATLARTQNRPNRRNTRGLQNTTLNLNRPAAPARTGTIQPTRGGSS